MTKIVVYRLPMYLLSTGKYLVKSEVTRGIIEVIGPYANIVVLRPN